MAQTIDIYWQTKFGYVQYLLGENIDIYWQTKFGYVQYLLGENMDINEILNKLIEHSNLNILSSHPVFLSVIQKEYHENYVYRLLA